MFVALFVLQFLWLRIPGKQGGAKNLSQNQKALDLAFCICTAFAAASLLRLYPGNARPPIQDSSAFLYIGKRMAEGKLPYRDLFDHKGPLLYLIQRVGIGLTPGSYIGVWILELVSMMISAWYMQKLAGLVTENRRDAYLAVLAVLGIQGSGCLPAGSELCGCGAPAGKHGRGMGLLHSDCCDTACEGETFF